jgi:hypothetical protein
MIADGTTARPIDIEKVATNDAFSVLGLNEGVPRKKASWLEKVDQFPP